GTKRGHLARLDRPAGCRPAVLAKLLEELVEGRARGKWRVALATLQGLGCRNIHDRGRKPLRKIGKAVRRAARKNRRAFKYGHQRYCTGERHEWTKKLLGPQRGMLRQHLINSLLSPSRGVRSGGVSARKPFSRSGRRSIALPDGRSSQSTCPYHRPRI